LFSASALAPAESYRLKEIINIARSLPLIVSSAKSSAATSALLNNFG